MNELDRYSGIISDTFTSTNNYRTYSFIRLKDAQKLIKKVKAVFGYSPELLEEKFANGKPHRFVVVLPTNLKRL